MIAEKCSGSGQIVRSWNQTGKYQPGSSIPMGICPVCSKEVQTYANSQALPAAANHDA